MEYKVMVSVGMITYNHERYIKEAIYGVLDQEVDFDYELIISNDRSTDGTDRVIQECIAAHPKGKFIRYFNQEINLGPQPNSAFITARCNGKYIAACEGDDFWTDKQKLQKQVDFLESNPKFSLCFHNASIVDENGTSSEKLFKSYSKDVFTMSDLLSDWLVPTASIVFRASALPVLPDWYHKAPVGDTPMLAMVAATGPMKLLPGVMSAYRVHSGGVTAKNDFNFWDKLLVMFENLDNHLGRKYHSLFGMVRADINYNIVKHALAVKDYGRLRAARREILRYVVDSKTLKSRHLKAVAASFFPKLSASFQ